MARLASFFVLLFFFFAAATATAAAVSAVTAQQQQQADTVVDPTLYPASISLFGGSATVYWKIDDANQALEVAVVSKANGWFGMGFGFENGEGMTNADLALITADAATGAVHVNDAWMQGIGVTPVLDTDNNGGTNDIALVKGSYSAANGIQAVFTRPLKATNAAVDKSIPTSGEMPVSFAYAKSLSLTAQHCGSCYTKTSIDFGAKNVQQPQPPSQQQRGVFPFHPIVVAAMLLIASLAALPVTYLPVFHNTRLGHLVFHRPLLPLLPNIYHHRHRKHIRAAEWLLAVPYALCAMSIAELSVLFLFAVVCIVWAAQMWSDAAAKGSLFPVGRAFGSIAQLTVAAMFLPVARNSIWTVIFGQSFERSITLHRMLSVVLWVSSTVDTAWYTHDATMCEHNSCKCICYKQFICISVQQDGRTGRKNCQTCAASCASHAPR